MLAPASPLRDLVVPRSAKGKGSNAADRVGIDGPQCRAKQTGGQTYIPWAELLKRVFGEDVLRCPHCCGTDRNSKLAVSGGSGSSIR